MFARILPTLLGLSPSITDAYTLVHNYDASNWYSSFAFQAVSALTFRSYIYLTLFSYQTQHMASLITSPNPMQPPWE
jgi:hypothetical protein